MALGGARPSAAKTQRRAPGLYRLCRRAGLCGSKRGGGGLGEVGLRAGRGSLPACQRFMTGKPRGYPRPPPPPTGPATGAWQGPWHRRQWGGGGFGEWGSAGSGGARMPSS